MNNYDEGGTAVNERETAISGVTRANGDRGKSKYSRPPLPHLGYVKKLPESPFLQIFPFFHQIWRLGHEPPLPPYATDCYAIRTVRSLCVC